MVVKINPELKTDDETTNTSPTERAFNIIELVAKTGEISIAEMIAALGIPRPTISRMVAILETSGYLRKTSGRGRYVIGTRLVNVAEDILRATAAQAPSHVVLMELSRAVGESCTLGVMRGGEVIYLDSVSTNAPLTLQFLAGQSAPLHCTSSGLLFLADMPKKQLDNYLKIAPWEPYTPHSVTKSQELAKMVNKVRDQGYATNDSGYVMGVVGIGVPIYGNDGCIIACLSVAAPAVRKTIAELEIMLPRLRAAALRIGRAMLNS